MRTDQMFINLVGRGDKCSFMEHKWSGSCIGVLQTADIQGKKAIQKGEETECLFNQITKYSFW